MPIRPGASPSQKKPMRVATGGTLDAVSCWLDRPSGKPRGAAAELARRIGKEAGLPPEKIEAFLEK